MGHRVGVNDEPTGTETATSTFLLPVRCWISEGLSRPEERCEAGSAPSGCRRQDNCPCRCGLLKPYSDTCVFLAKNRRATVELGRVIGIIELLQCWP